jgi:hypothetical protein
MVSIKRILIIIALLWGQAGLGEWGIKIESGGYLGNFALGGIYSWQKDHAVEASIGEYEAAGKKHYQMNLGYRWSPWKTQTSSVVWAPLHFGFFLIGSLDQSQFFTELGDTYPDDYYDENAIRAALQLGSSLFFNRGKLAVVYYLTVLENGIIAIYNNDWKNLTHFWSSGLALQYFF